MSWSSGKDSAWTLYRLQQQDECEVVGLMTAFNEVFQRSAMHGVRRKMFANIVRIFWKKTDFESLFPLWNEPTDSPAEEMIEAGLRAGITCMDPEKLNRKFAGHDFDRKFLRTLPAEVNPCGEYGEFHTFTRDGPMFDQAIQVQSGGTVEKQGFLFTDILPREWSS